MAGSTSSFHIVYLTYIPVSNYNARTIYNWLVNPKRFLIVWQNMLKSYTCFEKLRVLYKKTALDWNLLTYRLRLGLRSFDLSQITFIITDIWVHRKENSYVTLKSPDLTAVRINRNRGWICRDAVPDIAFIQPSDRSNQTLFEPDHGMAVALLLVGEGRDGSKHCACVRAPIGYWRHHLWACAHHRTGLVASAMSSSSSSCSRAVAIVGTERWHRNRCTEQPLPRLWCQYWVRLIFYLPFLEY